MKTLVLSQNFPPASGGSGRWFWELYSRLNNNYLVVADLQPNASDFDAQSSLPIERMPLYSPQWGLASLDGLKFYYRSYRQLRRLIKTHHIDMIHCGRVLPEGLMAFFLNKTMGIPYVCYVHGEDLEASALSRELNSLTKMVMRSASKIICNSHNSAAIVERVDSSVMSRVVVMHPGADTNKFVPAAQTDTEFLSAMGWQDKQLILTVGRLQARKGQDKMIEAMPDILKVCPQAHYVIIGHGECESLLRATVERLGLQEHVDILTQCDDTTMIKCYQHCEVFILPNRTEGQDIEGFGMVLVEAQACAKPVIAGNSGGTKETLIPGQTGEIVDATDLNNLSNTVVKFLQSPTLAKAYGLAGRKHAVSQFDWENAAKRATSVFSDIASR
ncbi:glycosyltransferase family 4 protein [Alteromonas sp. AMM-1]|uniref:glycosyltransferase family 4 protein n=1 Tax=Alteromonas sp. AMM-1 TaxID=3394233 RepID=UPI0039A63B7A